MDTQYAVLRRDASDHAIWTMVALAVEAHSADAASRKVAQSEDAPGTYVAVPVRSWNPMEQQKETTTVWKSAKP